jgi:membrane protease YdiL (CAAX protease family)
LISKKTILILAAGTLLVFGGLGAIFIPIVRESNLLGFISGKKALWLQLLVGLTFGVITANAGWQIVELPKLHKTKIFFTEIIRPLKLNNMEIVIISVCAGVGEELFFRGAIQPLLGIWTTSILFVLLHGYLNPFNLPLTYYGIYMVLVIGVMGLFTEHLGILTAIIAHVLIDYILLQKLSGIEQPPGESGSV